MREIKRLTVRSCPICRVAMVRSDLGWSCPQCGSTIVDGSRAEPDRRDETREQSPRAASGTLRT